MPPRLPGSNLVRGGPEHQRLLVDERNLKAELTKKRRKIDQSDRICDHHERVKWENEWLGKLISRLEAEFREVRTEMLERLEAEERRSDGR
jgi:hypothetical protein